MRRYGSPMSNAAAATYNKAIGYILTRLPKGERPKFSPCFNRRNPAQGPVVWLPGNVTIFPHRPPGPRY